MEASQDDAGVEAKEPPLVAGKAEQTAVQVAPPEQIRLYEGSSSKWGGAMTLKGTELTKARVMDTAQEETAALQGQLESLKCNYEGWINMFAWAALLE